MTQDQRSQTSAALQSPAGIPAPRRDAEYGSDVIVEMLRETGIPYVALNPGASFRGLHDSIVNFGEGEPPHVILCTHEEIAVAMAHGYARVTGHPIAVGLHDIVGLQHATMAIFNAWCDRVPVVLLGGTGPMDSEKRRPWIDWVHTALVQGNQVRDYVKWDDQPSSVEAFPDSILRAHRMATMEPQGPVYICFDATLQEQAVTDPIPIPDASRFAPPVSPSANPETLRKAASLLAHARWPLILADNAGRDPSAPASIQSLAELLGCGVIDLGGYFNFPAAHPLDVTPARSEALEEADVILALDVNDLASALAARAGRDRGGLELAVGPGARIIHITLADYLQRSWASDVQKLLPVDIPIAASPASALPELVGLCARELEANAGSSGVISERRRRVQELHSAAEQQRAEVAASATSGPISRARLYQEIWTHIAGTQWSLVSGAYSQLRSSWDFTEPQQFAGACRGAGLGYSLGASMGAALAQKGSGRLCIDIQGDGDLLYTPSGLWTAAHHQIPLLVIVVNNRTYGNDEEHQRYMAVTRGRPVENKGVGIYLEPPQTDFVALARSLGVAGFGPVTDVQALGPALQEAIVLVRERGLPALVDVVIQGL